jgi:hypothetical protein
MTLKARMDRLERDKRTARTMFVFGEVSQEEIDRLALASFGTTEVSVIPLPALSDADMNL